MNCHFRTYLWLRARRVLVFCVFLIMFPIKLPDALIDPPMLSPIALLIFVYRKLLSIRNFWWVVLVKFNNYERLQGQKPNKCYLLLSTSCFFLVRRWVPTFFLHLDCYYFRRPTLFFSLWSSNLFCSKHCFGAFPSFSYGFYRFDGFWSCVFHPSLLYCECWRFHRLGF